MQAPIEVTERSGEVFLLDILSHRMSEIAIFRQLTESVLPKKVRHSCIVGSRVHLRAACRKTYRSQQCDRSGQRQNRFPRKLEVCRECQIPIEPVRLHLIPREGREAGI